jgi:hypothetical protein
LINIGVIVRCRVYHYLGKFTRLRRAMECGGIIPILFGNFIESKINNKNPIIIIIFSNYYI